MSATERLQQILAETARRRKVWAEMQHAAREAVIAVTQEARRRGVRGQGWIGGAWGSEYTSVRFPTYGARLDELIRAKRPRQAHHEFMLHGSGTLERPNKDDTYQGYPDLVEDDPQHFRDAAVHQLVASLNAYLNKHGSAPKPGSQLLRNYYATISKSRPVRP